MSPKFSAFLSYLLAYYLIWAELQTKCQHPVWYQQPDKGMGSISFFPCYTRYFSHRMMEKKAGNIEVSALSQTTAAQWVKNEGYTSRESTTVPPINVLQICSAQGLLLQTMYHSVYLIILCGLLFYKLITWNHTNSLSSESCQVIHIKYGLLVFFYSIPLVVIRFSRYLENLTSKNLKNLLCV